MELDVAKAGVTELLPYLTPRERKELDHLLAPKAKSPMAIYRNDPVAFVHDCFKWEEGQGPAPYQDEVLGNIPTKRKICLRSPHGVGKTALASWATIWWAVTNEAEMDDWKNPTTASVWRQLTKFLWPEIHKWSRRLRWDKVHRPPFNERFEFFDTSLKLQYGEAFALASGDPAQIEGAHASRLLYTFDESKTIDPGTWDAAEGAFSTGDCYWLALSTPGDPAGRFYDIQTHKPGYDDWWVRHISLDEAIHAGRISREWADARLREWGPTNPVYQNRVEGNFSTESDMGVIPLTWIEKANERWEEWKEAGKPGVFTCMAVDVARMGEDKTCFGPRYGKALDELIYHSKQTTMETAGQVVAYLRTRGGYTIVDVIGVGAGVYDRIDELSKEFHVGPPYHVVPFVANQATEETDSTGQLEFDDLRALAWWGLRERLDPEFGDQLMLPPDDLLTGDLTAVHWNTTSRGKIRIESKDDIKKRIGRSTDAGDTVVMAFFKPVQTANEWIDAYKREKDRVDSPVADPVQMQITTRKKKRIY